MPPSSLQPAELRLAALHWLAECDATQKSEGVRRLARAWAAGEVGLDAEAALQATLTIPGHPEKPQLVSPLQVKRRAMNTPEGRAAMIHAMVHIEFNAIHLALDAVWRFPNMPRDYYADWLRVADEEVQHFDLLADHLNRLGYAYGDFPAHNGLWELALKTRHDVLARMALLFRTIEARGLDVTPGLRAKLVQAGDAGVGAIMDIILRDEIGHVAIGNRWFNWLCEQRGLEPIGTYARLATEYCAPSPRGPYNLEARRAAGFSETELAMLDAPGKEALTSFRVATPAEAEAVAALVNSAYRGESSRAGWTTEADILGGQRTDGEEIARLIAQPDAAIFLCRRANEIVGSVHLVRLDAATAYLGMLVVKPVFQGQGLGRRFMAEAERFVRARWGAARMQMLVITLRHELIAYYERRGYQRSGEIRPFPYGEPRFGLPKVAGLVLEVLEKPLE